MILWRDSSPIPAACQGAVLALGNFDGLHVGHRAILTEATDKARATGKKAGVLTFEPHPYRIFRPELPAQRLFPLAEKLRLLRQFGMDFVRVIRFTPPFSKLSAERFVQEVLHNQLHASHIVTGDDFSFGHNRSGNLELLTELGKKYGFTTSAVATVQMAGERCSSTRIREALRLGDVALASRLLGRPYTLSGRVTHGDQRGRLLGFPTANICPHHLFLPASGVYAVKAFCHSRESASPEVMKGVANLGSRPTFNVTQTRLEVHLFDWQGDLYERKLDVQFLTMVRKEQKFATVEALKAQIAEDCNAARRLLNSAP